MKKMTLLYLATILVLPGFARADLAPQKCELIVIAQVKVKKGFEDDFKKNAAEILQPTRSESGNISYNFQQSTTDATVFATYEQWQSPEDLTAHLNSATMKEFFSKVGPDFETGYPIIQTMKNIECLN